MLENIPLDKILFLDIETVAQQPDFNKVDERLQKFWEQKANTLLPKKHLKKLTPEPEFMLSLEKLFVSLWGLSLMKVTEKHFD